METGPYEPTFFSDDQPARDFAEIMAFTVENALSMVVIMDGDGVIQYVNKKFCKVTGYSVDEAIGQPVGLLKSGKTPKRTLIALWRSLSKEEGWTGEFVNRTKDGTIFWELAYISPVHDETGRIHHFLKIATDITSQKRLRTPLRESIDVLQTHETELRMAYRQLQKTAEALEKSRLRQRQLSQQDALTGLLNRRGFNDALRRTRMLAKRQGHGVGYLIIDIDRFKQINDEHGHAVGDRILKALAARLRSCLRSADLICRYGGDEFVVVLLDADATTTRLTAERIVDVVSRAAYQQEGNTIPFTVSIGTACETTESLLTPEQLLAQADQALYCVKHSGCNGMASFGPALGPARAVHTTAAEESILSRSCCAALGMPVAMLDIHERATGDHSRRVAKMSAVLAAAMALPPNEIAYITQGALLHDIGKIAIPTAVLLKPGPLTVREWQIMKSHPRIGYNILNNHPSFKAFADIVLSHHERHDGAGYPRGLKGTNVCLGARIVAVADAYDTIRSGRPYAADRSAAEALDEIEHYCEVQFDPAVVEALTRCQTEIEAVSSASLAGKLRRGQRKNGLSPART